MRSFTDDHRRSLSEGASRRWARERALRNPELVTRSAILLLPDADRRDLLLGQADYLEAEAEAVLREAHERRREAADLLDEVDRGE